MKFRKPSEYQPAPTLDRQIAETQDRLREWYALSERTRTTKRAADAACTGGDRLLLSHTDAELDPIRERARELLAQASAAADGLRRFEVEHGGEAALTSRLDGLLIQQQEQRKRGIRARVAEELRRQLKLLEALAQAQGGLDEIRREAQQTVGIEFAGTLPRGLPPGLFADADTPMSCALLPGMKLIAGRFDPSIISGDDPITQFLGRELFPHSLSFWGWR